VKVLINFPASQQVSKPNPFLENRIKRLLVEHKKIEVVEVYREAYHRRLKEAKDAVDIIEIQMHMENHSSLPSTP